MRVNVGLSAGAVVRCRRLGQATVLTHSSRGVTQEWANPLCPSKAEATNEVDDGYTLSVVQKRQRSKSWEFRDALAKLTEEDYDVWDIWSLLRWLGRRCI